MQNQYLRDLEEKPLQIDDPAEEFECYRIQQPEQTEVSDNNIPPPIELEDEDPEVVSTQVESTLPAESPVKEAKKQKKKKTKPEVPIHMRIPKIALNFTKWKLQKRMVEDLKEISDPS